MTRFALALALATVALAQTTDSAGIAAFEVASIRPGTQDGHRGIDTDNNLFQTHNVSLKRLIAYAWQIEEGQVSGGPNWVDSDSYDINARIPEEFVHRRVDRTLEMVQRLLTERFQLVIHRESRQIAGYELVVTRKGSKLEHVEADAKGSDTHATNTHLSATNVTMEAFARRLSRNRDIGKLVVDKTGLPGGYNIELDWMPEGIQPRQEAADDHPSIFTALQERLGLKLESAKVSALAIVIDRAAKPDAN